MMIALTPRIPICRTAQYFNPHFRKGSDSYSHPHADFTNISIHTSAREVTKYGKKAIYHLDDFNPHFRKGSDRFLIFCLRLLNIFQSTLPQGKWLVTPYKVVSKGHFNPHFRKGSDYPVRNIPASPDNFNPHFRKGSDAVILHLHVCPTISIHTSAREVTHFFSFLSYDIYISIHTSAREVTKCSLRCIAPCCISIHTSAREVTERERDPEGEGHISIHTSAREVTAGKVKIPVRDTISIHTSAREVTMCCNGIRWYKWFQSTLPQGKWPLVTRINGFSLQISIHTSAREVTYKRKAKDEASRFQSTLPQGKWRKSFWTKLCNLSYFNPHFRKGSDFSAFSIVFCSSISIHTSAREVTDILIRPPPCLKFQSTLPQGKWRILGWWCFGRINFNPHFRKGSDDEFPCSSA